MLFSGIEHKFLNGSPYEKIVVKKFRLMAFGKNFLFDEFREAESGVRPALRDCSHWDEF